MSFHGRQCKATATALILAILLPGVDRMYLGYVGLGILELITGGGFLIWWIYDIVKLVGDKSPGSEGCALS